MARGIAIGVAIVLAAAAGTLVLSPRVPRPQPVAAVTSPSALPAASASPAPAPPHDSGTPPAGVPLIYGGDPANPLWITGFDWQGRPRGTIQLTVPLAHQLVVETHCYVLEDQQTYDDVLYTVLGAAEPRRIAVIGNEGNLGQTGIDTVECNFQANLAIAVRTAVMAPSDTWVLRLSDGAKLAHWSYPAGGITGVVPSSDGKLIAEIGTASTQIRSIPDGAIVATLPHAAVYAFSGDDRFVVEGPLSTAAPMSLVDWRTNREVWRSAGSGWPEPVQVEPGTGDVAIAIASQEQESSLTQDYSKPIIIVHADGTETDLPGKYVPLFPPYADGNYPYKGGPP
ncbi:MAG TPA: hypothetical protein VLU92_03645 [Candidatus Dormibacteraeota bacterium]|nr:hypothetical protein [Candidatus Dormibacteraeota bacterium]